MPVEFEAFIQDLDKMEQEKPSMQTPPTLPPPAEEKSSETWNSICPLCFPQS